MADISNKETLINKFKEGSITKSEVALLKKYFASDGIPDELLPLFEDWWNNASSYNETFEADSSWNEISSAIGRPGIQPRIPKQKQISFRRLLQYAAVFVLAFGIAWFLRSLKFRSEERETHYCEVEVSYGSKSKIVLPDGTRVILNSGSFIRYPSRFVENNRDIYFEGEAYFDVVKNAQHPFIVSTQDIKIRVVGTTFNVKAYPEDKKVETTLITGRVDVNIENASGYDYDRKSIVLKPGQKLNIIHASHDERDIKESRADIGNISVEVLDISSPAIYTSWKDNILEFDNERFCDLTTRLERWYNVTIINNCPEINEAHISGKFERETIEQALDALNLTIKFDYTIDKDVVTINNNY